MRSIVPPHEEAELRLDGIEVVVRYERAEDLLSERADEEAEVHRHAYNRVRVPDTDEHGNDGVVLCDRCRGDEQLPELL